MKKILKKSLVLMVAVFLGVLFTAPAMIHADTATVVITPENGEIPALGQTAQFTAVAIDGVGSETDVTATASWGIGDANIATNNGGGLFTGKAQGDTWVSATFEGVTGGASLYVSRGYMGVDVYNPGEDSYFDLWASGCNGLPWSLDVTGPTTYSASGTITADDWHSSASATLSAGDYEATFSIDGVEQGNIGFVVYEHEEGFDVEVGYAGETTKFTLVFTNSTGMTADFELWKMIGADTWEDLYIEEDIPIDNDNWSYTINRTLPKGDYCANFWVNNYDAWVDGYCFSVVNRGVPQPPVEKAAPKEHKPAGPTINEKPLSNYEKTASGFSTLFYNRFLRRNPEQEGLNAWTAGLESGAITGSDLIYSFIFGEECQNVISEYTNEEFITFLYKAIFNRKPDEEGYNTWLSRMAGGLTKEEVVKHFGSSVEFTSLCKLFGITPYQGYTGTSE
jgi:hypothetical protein